MSDVPRLRRFLWWISDLPIIARLWLLDRIAGPFPRPRLIEFESTAKSGCGEHSRMSMWTGLARDLGDARAERACLWRRRGLLGISIRWPLCRGLQLDDRPSDSSPEGLAVKIATFEHQVGALRGHNLGIRTVLPDE
jgi:hypothetical protein